MWILFSTLMFLSSNLLYLSIRKAQKEGILNSLYSIAMFLIPAFTYFILSILTKTSLVLSVPHFILVIFTAFLWSYLGNYFSQKGILYASNPGYSLVIQKSYAVLTTIGAIFLFGSAISVFKFLGIVLILFFTAVISLGGKTSKSDRKWLLFSLLAHLSFAFGSLMSKQFLNLGLEPYQYLFYITLFVSVLNFIESKKNNISFQISKQQGFLLFLIGIFSVGFNLFMQFGYKFAPNPGYVVAINTSSIMTVTILSALIFKDALSKQKIFGIIGVLSGLLMLTFA